MKIGLRVARISPRDLIQWFCITETVLLGFVLVLLRDDVLPPRFLADGLLIGEIARGRAQADDSYVNVAMVYRFLGLGTRPLLAYTVGYSLAVFAIFLAWRRSKVDARTWQGVAIICSAVLLAAVYLGYYSKDVFVTPIAIAALVLPIGRWSNAALLALMVAYGYWFRQYWLVVAAVFLVLIFVLRRFRPRSLPAWGMAGSAGLSLAVFVVLDASANSFRSSVNAGRVAEDVGTRIDPFVNLVEPLGGVVNNVLTYWALILPVPVLFRGGIYYFAIALFIAFIWIVLYRAVRHLEVGEDPLVVRCVGLSVALLVTQSLFEPDYGSALRHLTPMLPLVACAVWRGQGARVSISGDFGIDRRVVAEQEQGQKEFGLSTA
ncbi:hypothetical protein ATL41_2141 [Flavimobilis soli]|uniref:Dolichyl-phosphate-mannose-protein mannosyltransferase n=1 Tax=Flavimobilis soli TaxID=442709 RepID=A0A2A9EGL7_9MICO|nr:hypothetical protein [Flavimobilis soli]PFG37382.1 hypothetical protein ATL41_2141 [Flavimobilis soli]